VSARPVAAIVGIAGTELTAEEAAMLAAHPPVGLILFGRNVRDPEQMRSLTASLRAVLPDAHILIDQEGGRVARLRPPHWLAHPAAGLIGNDFSNDPKRAIRLAWLCGALIGGECAALGIDVVAAPVLDLLVPGASNVVGDRSFGSDPWAVGRLGRSFANGLMAAGVVPIGKHTPGHGRGSVDSHYALPELDDVSPDDLVPFAMNAHLPWLMTAHIVYRAVDAARPGTLSETVIRDVIRGRIGFGGVLVSDDLSMQAVSGTPAELAVRAVEAGCDLALYGSGDFDRTRALSEICPTVSEMTAWRLTAGRCVTQRRVRLDLKALAAERDELLARLVR
jgi:beta-N-acetylhexosaminidase